MGGGGGMSRLKPRSSLSEYLGKDFSEHFRTISEYQQIKWIFKKVVKFSENPLYKINHQDLWYQKKHYYISVFLEVAPTQAKIAEMERENS